LNLLLYASRLPPIHSRIQNYFDRQKSLKLATRSAVREQRGTVPHPAFRILAEKALQPIRRDVGGDAGRVNTGPGDIDGLAVNVRGKYLHLEGLVKRLQALLEQDGDGIGLLAGGAYRLPDADRRPRGFAGKELRDHLFLEGREGFGVPEETGDADKEVPEEGFPLGRILLHVAHVPVQPVDLVDGHAPPHVADQGVLLVEGKIMARMGAQQDADLFQRVFGLRGRGRDRAESFAEGVGGVGDELGGHLRRRQDIIRKAGGDGAPRHAVVLGGFGVLRHDHAPLGLDRPLALVLGEAVEEKVDGLAHAPGEDCSRSWSAPFRKAMSRLGGMM